MKNYKIVIEYDGSEFYGWQVQPDKQTIQGRIQEVIKQITSEEVVLHGSGRTDSGVHAKGQVANFNIVKEIEQKSFLRSLNALLRPCIKIATIKKMNFDFHARFSAVSRLYNYNISQDYFPLDRKKFWYVGSKVNKDLLDECASIVIGEHDFSSFSKRNPDIENKKCIVMESFWEYDHDILRYYIRSNRFIQHMVRFLVGSMIEVSREKLTLDDFISILNNRSISASAYKAPANGLALEYVSYG